MYYTIEIKICILICFISYSVLLIFRIKENSNINFIMCKFINESRILNNEIKQLLQNYNKSNQKKIIGISYSNNELQTQLKYCKKSALEIGKVDLFYDYGPNDIDIEFKQINYEILFRQNGDGYWLWKPYFILKTLKEKLEDGDYLIYTDATVLYKENVKVLIDFLQKKDEDMWFYKQNYLEKFHSKRDAFILMGADNEYYSETFSYNAAFQIYKKSKFSLKFVTDYLYYARDKRIITNDTNTLSLPNYNGYKNLSHDQTILSLLIKKYNLANSGRANINYTYINNIESEMPFIFCHYKNLSFNNYDNLKSLCKI